MTKWCWQFSSTPLQNFVWKNCELNLCQDLIFDRHNDWPYQMRRNRRNVLNNISLYDDFTQYYTPSHTDIPRIREGRLGAQVSQIFCDFFNIPFKKLNIGLLTQKASIIQIKFINNKYWLRELINSEYKDLRAHTNGIDQLVFFGGG